MRIFLLLTLFLLIAPTQIQAQDEWQVITADNAAQLQEMRHFGNGRLMRATAWSPDARWIAAAGTLGIWIYDTTDLNRAPVFLEGHTQPILNLAFSPDGLTLVSSGYDGTVILWDFASQTQRFVLNTESDSFSRNWVHSLAFRHDGVLATGHYGMIRFWDVTTGEEVAEPLELCRAYVTDIAFNADDSLLACVGQELYGDTVSSYVAAWDIANDTALELQEQPVEAYVEKVQFSEDNSELIGIQTYCAACEGWLEWTWSLVDDTLEVTETPIAFPAPFTELPPVSWSYIEYSPDGTRFSYIEGNVLKVGDTQTGDVVTTPDFFWGGIYSLSINGDGAMLAVERENDSLMWNINIWQNDNAALTIYAFHPTRRETFAVADAGSSLHLVNYSTGQAFNNYVTQNPVVSISFNGDGTLISARTESTPCAEGEACVPNFYVWEMETMTEIYSMYIENNFVYALSTNGSQLVYSDGLTTTLLNFETGESQPVSAVGDTIYQYINEMTFSPDDTLIAAGTGGGVLGGNIGASTLWEVGSQAAPAILNVESDSEDVPYGAVYAVDFNADGTLLLDTSAQIGFSDNVLRIWDVASQELLVTLYGHHDQVTDAIFSPDGRFIYSSGLDGTVRMWGVPAAPAS